MRVCVFTCMSSAYHELNGAEAVHFFQKSLQATDAPYISL